MILIGGDGGVVKGYTGSDVATVVNTMNLETKARIYKMMSEKLNNNNEGEN